MTSRVTHSSIPGLFSAYALLLRHSLAGNKSSSESAVGLSQVAESIYVDRSQLQRYREICGYERFSNVVPICFPHLPAAALQLRILAAPEFPCATAGLVHVSHDISQTQPLSVSTAYSIESQLVGDELTERGREFSITTTYRDGSTTAWKETMRFLKPDQSRRKKDSFTRPESMQSDNLESANILVSGNIGRQYARVSGDYNPIHLFDFTARLFGFPGRIAHGMWALSRCINELPSAAVSSEVKLDVKFKLPLFSPSQAVLEYTNNSKETRFVLREADSERPYLCGTLTTSR